MIDAVSHVSVWVHDQDEAKEFYTEKLGLEVRYDAVLEDAGGYRWLTVGPADQPDVQLILSVPGPPAMDPDTAKQLLELVSKGVFGPGILRTEDCRATCEKLEARGVEFIQQPDERFYGIDAAIRDPSGNHWRVVQPIEFDLDEMQRQSGKASA